jgi:hypothetical protein
LCAPVIDAKNGLKVTTDSIVELGGPLITPTTIIASGSNPLTLAGADSASVVVSAPLAYTSGSPATGMVLTSDAKGNAAWQYPGVRIIPGSIPSGSGYSVPWAWIADPADIHNPPAGTYHYTGPSSATSASITLPPGKWLVYVQMLMYPSGANNTAGYFWLRTSFSDNPTTPSVSYDVGVSSIASEIYISGMYYSPNTTAPSVNTDLIPPYSMLQGWIVINNTSSNSKTYYYITGPTRCSNAAAHNSSITGRTILNFGGDSWSEDMLFAVMVE